MNVSLNYLGQSSARSRWAVRRLVWTVERSRNAKNQDVAIDIQVSQLANVGPFRFALKKALLLPTLSLLLCYGLHLAATIGSAGSTLTSFAYLLSVGNLIRAFTSIVSIIHIITSRNDILNILTGIENIFHDSLSEFVSRTRRFSLNLCAFCFGSCLLHGTLICVSSLSGPCQDFYQARFYGVNCSRLPSAVRVIPILLDAPLLSITSSVTAMMACFFIAVCYMLSLVTLHFSHTMNLMLSLSASGKLAPGKVKDALLRLFLTGDAVCKLNMTYGPIMFWWYVDLLRSFLFSIPALLVAVTTSKEFFHYSFVLVDLTRDVIVFLLMSLVASDMARHVEESVVHSLKVADSMDDVRSDVRLAVNVEMLVNAVQETKVQLSGREFFHVDRSLINRVLSIVATFAIIVFQFLS
ncbi:unnamed protein product [Ixodes persulcatus]